MNRVRLSLLLPSACLALVALLCACSSVANEEQRVLHIEGITTQLRVQIPLTYVESLGDTSLVDHPRFRMDEWVIPSPLAFLNPEAFSPNFGVISAPAQENDSSNVCIGFVGRAMGGAVNGFFRAIETVDPCPPPLHPSYSGNVDNCDLGCTPLLDPECPREFEGPVCTGFTVQFDFH